MTRRWLRRAGLALGALVALACLVAAASFAWLRTSLPQLDGALALPGLSAPVEIRRDRDGVPTIVAADPLDAIRAQGFVHAQDRLFQMDFMRVLARGRLAEFVGRPGLASDRLVRALDLAGVAERSVAALAPETRAWLEAYAEGVNAFLATRSGAWPPEFLLTGRRPEPWTPADTLLWGQLMALQLSGNWREELTRLRLAQRHPRERVALLWPDWPADAATTLAGDARLPGSFASGEPGSGEPADDAISIALDAAALDRLAAALPPAPASATASNAWVLAASRSATGKPILANDPHLGLVAPGPWYLVRIEAPGLTLAGASAPGVPGVVLGRNARVAWGLTTTNADTNDLFVERIAPGAPGRYVTETGDEAFVERAVAIGVKDAPDERFVVRTTRHGVVISDLAAGAGDAAGDGHVLALASTLRLEPDHTADALVALNRARDAGEAVAALAAWRAPIQNVFFADVEGRVGMATAGAIPRRKAGDGWWPLPGWTGAAGWDGVASFADMPRALDPPSGVLLNANNRLVPDGFSPFLGRDWDAPYRAERIRAALAAAVGADVDASARLQTDAISPFAVATLGPGAAGATPSPRVPGRDEPRLDPAALRRLLAAWDARAGRRDAAPLVFNAWMRRLQRELVLALLGDDPALPALAARDRPHLARMAFEGDPRLCGAFDCKAAIERSLREATAALAKRHGDDASRWRWGDAHRADFPHPVFARLPIVGRFLAFGLPTDGDNFTVNRGTPGERDSAADFPHVHGPTLRAVYDLADLDRSRFMIAPGQSGNPLSPHWGDLAPRWAEGQYRTLGPGGEVAARLTLAPAGRR